jgi:HNH endonuclease
MAHRTGRSAKSAPGTGGTRSAARRKNTIPQAKNRMRRTVAEILDPGPSNIDRLWEHFEARCAYCDRELSRSGREAHCDHAIPGGGNHLGNLILACGRCNGDEKREQGWREFLTVKAPPGAVFNKREHRIRSWLTSHPLTIVEDSAEVLATRADLDRIIQRFGDRCADLKLLVAERGGSDD